MFNESLAQFLDHLKYERNVSDHTIRNYASDLEQFRDFLLKIERRDDFPVEHVDRLTIREWMASLHSANRKKTSV
ncbi:MAG: site-specific integrase, partial [Pyrinomonadaceae bacterium]